jgi:hypothetical protein
MKTKLFILTICAAVLSLGTSANVKDTKALTGNSLTDFGKYTVMVSEMPMVLDNEVVKTYELTYENTANPVHVGVVEEEECVTYVVRSDEFEIQYTCNNGVFGVKKIESRFQTLPKEELDAKLNRVSYFQQRVICSNKKSEDEILGLIACYFPQLINEEYQASF